MKHFQDIGQSQSFEYKFHEDLSQEMFYIF